MTSYIGIDQSYTGLAIIALGEHGCSENVANFEAKKYGSGIDRLIAIYHHVFGVLGEQDSADPIGHVCMEGYAQGSKYGREIAGELAAIVKLATYDTLAPSEAVRRYPTIVSPSAVKKFASGNSQSRKNNMLLAVYKKWGYDTRNDNLADAYTLAHIAKAIHTQPETLVYEKEVLDKLTVNTEKPAA